MTSISRIIVEDGVLAAVRAVHVRARLESLAHRRDRESRHAPARKRWPWTHAPTPWWRRAGVPRDTSAQLAIVLDAMQRESGVR